MKQPTDPTIIIELPLSCWNVVSQHLARGSYADVAEIIHAMTTQSIPQIEAASRALLDQAAAMPVESLDESPAANSLN